MWITLNIEIYVFLIALLLVVVRSILREHEYLKDEFFLICASLIFLCGLKIGTLFLPFSSYLLFHHVAACVNVIMWITIPYLVTIYSIKFCGYSRFLRRPLTSVVINAPIVVIVTMSLLSSKYSFIYNLNLFGTPVFGQFYYCLDLGIIFYSSLSIFNATGLFFKNRASNDKKRYFMYVSSVSVLCAIQLYSGFVRSSLFIIMMTLVTLVAYVDLISRRVFVDTLTGLNNRNLFNKYLSNVLESAEKERAYLTYVDVDDFKKINDTYGHHTGDIALRTIAESMRDLSLDFNTFNVRLGGDEFAILSFHYYEKELKEMVETLKHRIQVKAKTALPGITLSLSVGSTSLNVPDLTAKDLIKKADHKMYVSKQMKKRMFEEQNSQDGGSV